MAATDELCAECGEPLTDEEKTDPADFGDGKICDNCYYDNHFWRCDYCGEYESDSYTAEFFAVLDADEADLPTGIYRILQRPFYCQPLIGGGWIYPECVERIADLPSLHAASDSPCALLCSTCTARYVPAAALALADGS